MKQSKNFSALFTSVGIFNLFVLLGISGNLFSQNIILNIDSTSKEASVYAGNYTLKKSNEMGSSNWLLGNSGELDFSYGSDQTWNSKILAGQWELRNDSIIFLVTNKKFLKRSSYSSKEAFTPFIFSWELVSDSKCGNDTTSRMVFNNKIIVLNKSESRVELLNEISDRLTSSFDRLKNNYDYFSLDEKIRDEITDLLYSKNLFSYLQSERSCK